MKRPLMVLAAGFVLGEVLALQGQKAVSQGLWWWLYAASGLLGMWSYRILSQPSGGKRQGGSAGRTALLLIFLLAATGGMAGYVRAARERARLDYEEASSGELEGAGCAARGRAGKVALGDGKLSLVLEDVEVRAGKTVRSFDRVIVYVSDGSGTWGGDGRESGLPDLLPGMTVEIKGRMEAIEGPRNPGEFDFKRYYRSKGTAARIFGDQIKVISGEGVPYQTFLMKFRSGCADILDRICLPQDSAVFKAILLGDTSDMEPKVRSMYQRHGISHLLAVSGQHLAIIGGGIYLIMRRMGLGYKWSGGLGALLVISYGIMTGSSGSAIRAVIMTICLWLGASLGRSYDTLSALGLAAILLLWKSPYLLFASGFQLSFAAVSAIGGLGGWLGAGYQVEKGWRNTVLISLCVQIAITPVVLYHYYQYPLYGIFLNLLVIPLIAVLMYSGILGIILGSFWLKGGVLAVGAGHYVLCFYEWLCRQVERLPGYCLVMGRPSWFQILMYGGGMAAALYWFRHYLGLKEKPRFPILVTACLYSLFFLVLLPLPKKDLEIIMLDVGQGDGILMHTEGFTILVDGGSSSEKNLGEKTLEPYLKSRGIRKIDYAIVSHGDSDHISGLLYLMESSEDIVVKNLVLPMAGRGQEIYGRLKKAAEAAGGRVLYMAPPDCIQAGSLYLTCLYAGGSSPPEDDRNAHSLVLCADYKGFHMLLTGDMGAEQEKGLLELAEGAGNIQREHLGHVQVLKAAHHGSDTSNSGEFLDCLSPDLALVSYGRGNSYGHPSPEVMERMKERRIPVMETGYGGAVIMWTDGKMLQCGYFKASAQIF